MNEIILDQDTDGLIHFLHFHGFKYLDQHEKLVQYAYIFKHKRNGKISGYTWIYEYADEPFTYGVHMCIDKREQGKVLTRNIVNKFYQECYNLGVKVLEVNAAPKNLLNLYSRIGFEKTNHETVRLYLPYQWRKQHGQSQKNNQKSSAEGNRKTFRISFSNDTST